MSSCFNGDWQGRQLGMVAALLAVLACGSASAQRPAENLPFESSASGRVYNGTTPLRLWHQTRGYGMEASQTAFGGRLAVDLADAIGFMDGQFRVSNESQFGMDVGGGFRWMAPSLLTGDTRVFGITGWYDGQETNLNNYFNQLGVSFESLGEQIDFRFNANIPLENEKSGDVVIDTGTVSYFQNFLTVGTLIPTDVALRIVDFEVAPRIFDLNAWVYAGGYQMDGNDVSDMGAKGGVRGYVTNDLAVDVGVQNDDVFGTNTVFQIIWTPGRTGAGPTSWVHTLADRMREQVYRNTYVATTQVERTGGDNLTDVDGDDIRVVHVDFTSTAPGDGTFENPYTSINSANGTGSQQGDIILVHAQNGANVYNAQSLTLQDEQRFLGEGGGVEHEVVTQQMGTVILPPTFAGALNATRPTLQNAPGVAVTLAGTALESENFSQMEVSNFDITGGTNAVKSGANGVAAVNINNLHITSTTGNAIELAAMTQTLENGTTRSRFAPTIDEIEFDNVGGDDILLTSTTSETTIVHSTAISNITSDNGNGVGINLVQNQRAATINNFDWNGGTTGDGALRIFEAGTQGAVTLSNSAGSDDNVITGGQVGTAYAINIDNSAATHTVTGTKISAMGGDSIVVDDGAANLNFTGEIVQTTNAQSILSVTGGHTGTLNFTELTADAGVIRATMGDGLQFNDMNGVYIFNDEVELTGTTAAINVTGNSDGDITLANGQFTNTTGDTITFAGGEANLTFNGKILQNQNVAVLSVTAGHDGTLAFNDLAASPGVISATNGTGLQFSNADGAYTFNDAVVLNGGNAAIDVVAGSEGTFTFADTDITNPGAGPAVRIDASSAIFTFTGDIVSNNDDAVVLNANTGGSVTFAAASTIKSTQGIDVTANTGGTFLFAGNVELTGTANGVEILNNTGGSTQFNDIDITKTGTGTGFRASSATTGHTVTVTGNNNTISTQTGVALQLNTVAVGTNGVNFQSVSSNGAVNGIVLNNLTGGAVLIGATGSAFGDGGTIANSTEHAVLITNAANVSLNNMDITGTNAGFDGVNVNHTNAAASTVTINHSSIENGGAGIEYNRSASGTSRLFVTDNDIDNTGDQGLAINVAGSGAANVTIRDNSIANTASGNEGILVQTTGGSNKTLNLLIDSNTVQSDTTTATVVLDAAGNGTVNATVTSNTNFQNLDGATGKAFTATTNNPAATIRMNLNGNAGNDASAGNAFVLTLNSGNFSLEDMATVNTRNTGGVTVGAGITDDAGPIPPPN
ncbi:MAG: hypothetical protein JNL18_11120 [Planctomycetaceae bacterium]|nr:hypothetical protein [Planctomycetaceae bacterium]